MSVPRIVIAAVFAAVTVGTTWYAWTGPGLDTYMPRPLVTDTMTRAERQEANAALNRARREERERYRSQSGSIRGLSGGNSRYRGRVK